MHVPFLAPKILRIVPIVDPEPGVADATWVEFQVSSDNGLVAYDLCVRSDVSSVADAIERAKATDQLLILACSLREIHPVTGRPWLSGLIGPVSELEPPPIDHMIHAIDADSVSSFFAPKIIGVSAAGEANDHLANSGRSVVEIEVGDDVPGRVSVAVTGQIFSVWNEINGAKALGRPLVFWTNSLMGLQHKCTGHPIYIGELGRLNSSRSRA